MAQFVAQRVGPASTLCSTVDISTDDEKELHEGHPQALLFSSCFNSTGVADSGEAKKEPFRQEERRHPAATVDAHVAKKKRFRKELHQDSARSQSCSGTTFVQDVTFHVEEAGKEVYSKARPHLVKVVKVQKVAFQRASGVLKGLFCCLPNGGTEVAVYDSAVKVVKAVFQSAGGFFCCLPNGGGEFADEVESEPLLQQRRQEHRSNFVTCDDVGEEGKKPLYPECHSKMSAVGENSDHTTESNYSNLAEAAQAIGGSESKMTLAKSPKQDMCDDGDGDQVGGASAEFIATAVQRTDGLVESVARRNTAEHRVDDGIAAGDIITVNIAGPGEPAEVLGGLSLPGFLHTIKICPYLSE